ncbi:MAG: sigma-54 dependent transcriptional regulator [Tannerella sp.]|jgi:DNA-binding NtrC family response regulator|nr:sigma-54 dependent transcriptional regulator [Tannerella sp.]
MKKGSILIVDDNRNVLTALRLLLSNYFETVTLLPSPNGIYDALRDLKPDVALLDMNFSAGINSGNEGLYWLSEIKKHEPDLPVVLFTAYADIDLAVSALKRGATDFVVKPWDNSKLVATLQSAYNLRESRKEVKFLREKQSVLHSELNRETAICWGQSAIMDSLRRMIEKIASTDANILITGENGTGKEVIAREIHRLSSRNNEALITVDMGAITETLFESELFGYVKGAFTDAKTDRAGKFEAANGGTLFLDEIGNLSYPLQAKMLNALQSRLIRRVGSNTPIPVNIRLLCATNRNLPEMVAKGEFREDLLYRINTIQIEMPPLRERREDIPLLADFFLRKYAGKYKKNGITLSAEAVRKLQNYSWHGNIRELQHTLEKAVILSDSAVLQADEILLNKRSDEMPKIITLEEAEKQLIIKSLKRHNNNLTATADELGTTRQTLYNKIKKYNF